MYYQRFRQQNRTGKEEMLLIFRVNPLGELPQNSPGQLTLFEPGVQIMPITPHPRIQKGIYTFVNMIVIKVHISK